MCDVFSRLVELPEGKRKKELDVRTRILRSTNAGGSMRRLAILFTAGVLLSALAVADDWKPTQPRAAHG